MNKNLIIIIAVVIVGGLAFFGGTYYQEQKTRNEIAEFSDFTPEERQERFQSGEGFPGGPGRRSGSGPGQGGGFGGGRGFGANLEGKIDKIEDDRIIMTTQLGSQTVKFNSELTVEVSNAGTIDDLEVGSTILIKVERGDDEFTAERIIVLQK